MNKLKVFTNEEFGKVRTAYLNNGIYFVGKDIAEILGYTNTAKAIRDHIDDEDKLTERIVLSGQNREVIFINESGLYSLILSSNMPNAKTFKHWVTSEVLPSVRKNGGYISGQETDSPEMIVAKALVVAQNIIQKHERKLAELTPKAEYFDDLVERNLLTNFRDTAKELHIKQKGFVTWLLEKHYIYRDGRGKLKPYQTYVDKGYFELKEFVRGDFSDIQTLITPRGREAFRLLCK